MEFLSSLEVKFKEWGASFVGYSDIGERVDSEFLGLKYAISIGVRLSDYIVDQIEDAPTYTYFHHYRTVNSLIDSITLRGTNLIQETGHLAVPVPASQTVNDKEDSYRGIFPHKTAAVLAGLGWIGKNGLFISECFGPRVRLGTILTNYKLPIKSFTMRDVCGDCRKCIESCPSFALTGNTWHEGCDRNHIIDAKACSDYMNKHFKHIGRGSVCGICVKVCPKRRN